MRNATAAIREATVAGSVAARARYTTTAIVLHWIIAVAVIGQVAMGWWMQEIPKVPFGPRANAFNLHKSIGMTVLMIMAVRLAWRASHRPPSLPEMPPWQARAARVNHWVLYVCLFVQPLTGYLGSAVSGYPVLYFGLALPAWAPKSIFLKDLLSLVHLVDSCVLAAAIAIHIAAALKHQLVDQDHLLRRMWPWRAA
ncbi:MAG TPA: cytochrome b [Casimicrobiaceae bacterium]|nr:cytochrome b [Casimicrobiaceae bacterium]